MLDFWRFFVPRKKNTTPFVSPRRTEFLDYDPDLACGRRTTSTMIGKAEKTCFMWENPMRQLGLMTMMIYDDGDDDDYY